MSNQELQSLHRQLTAALGTLEKIMKRPSENLDGIAARNPDHFRDTGHLTDAGISAIYELFDQGYTIEQAAQEMGVSVRGAASRRQSWIKRRTK